MVNIIINNLQPTESELIEISNNFPGNTYLHELTLQETTNIYGGAGLTPGEGLTFGTSVLSAGIGVVAMATGPVGLFAGGFLYGAGFLLATYSAYQVGGGSGGYKFLLR
jgi:hypothetical protein